MLKDWKKVHRKLRRLRGLNEHEKVSYARSLAATPDERIAYERDLSQLARLMAALGQEKIRSKLPGSDYSRFTRGWEGKMNWLPDMDLNHDKQIQSLLCYRYTIGQTSGLSLEPRLAESSSRQRSPQDRRPKARRSPNSETRIFRLPKGIFGSVFGFRPFFGPRISAFGFHTSSAGLRVATS